MKYQAAYKCPLCGYIHIIGEPQEVPYDKLPELCNRFIQNQMFKSNPYLYEAPEHMICHCSDGSVGLAQFVGFRRVKE